MPDADVLFIKICSKPAMDIYLDTRFLSNSYIWKCSSPDVFGKALSANVAPGKPAKSGKTDSSRSHLRNE